MKKLVDKYYGEGIFQLDVEDDLSPLFTKASDNQKMTIKEGEAKKTCCLKRSSLAVLEEIQVAEKRSIVKRFL